MKTCLRSRKTNIDQRHSTSMICYNASNSVVQSKNFTTHIQHVKFKIRKVTPEYKLFMKHIMKTRLLPFLLFLIASSSIAQVPGTLSYQGILMQNDGITPIADGAHSIVYNFYTVSTAGLALFSRTIAVTTAKGLYTSIIGGGIAPNAPFTTTEMGQLGSQQIFIGITVDGGSELTPRAQLTTAAYAYQAQSSYTISDGAVTSAKILDGTIVDADVNASAAIAGTKISPAFGAQNISTTGTVTSGAVTATSFSGNGSALTNIGTAAIASGAILDADVNASAAIAGTKIVPAFGTQPISTTGNISGNVISGVTLMTGFGLNSGNQYIQGSPSPTNAEGAVGSEAAIHIQRQASGVKNTNTADIKVSTWESGITGRTSMEFWLSGLPQNENTFGTVAEIPVLTLHGDDLGGTSNYGRVGIGTLFPTSTLHVYNGSTSGTYTTSGWVHSSDERLKTNIKTIGNPMSIVKSLRGVYFNWKSNSTNERQVGFIAQEVKRVLPEVVTGKEGDIDKGEILGMSNQNIVAVLVEAIKEQQAQIEELKAGNKNLEQRLASIEASLSKNQGTPTPHASKTEKP